MKQSLEQGNEDGENENHKRKELGEKNGNREVKAKSEKEGRREAPVFSAF